MTVGTVFTRHKTRSTYPVATCRNPMLRSYFIFHNAENDSLLWLVSSFLM